MNFLRLAMRVAAILIFSFAPLAAQDSNKAKAAELVTLIKKIDGLRSTLSAKIAECDQSLRDCDRTIESAEALSASARRNGNAAAKERADRVLKQARDSRAGFAAQRVEFRRQEEELAQMRKLAEAEWRSYEFPEEGLDPLDLRFRKKFAAFAERLGWSPEKRKRLDESLQMLGAGLPDPADRQTVREVWSAVTSRGGDAALAEAASKGDGPGLPASAREQTGNDCAVHALAAASGLPYEDIASKAKTLIRAGDWRLPEERENPQKVLEAGLMGGEVVLVGESLGQIQVVAPDAFAASLGKKKAVMVNIALPEKTDNAGHQVALMKTFRYAGETWFQMADSNHPGQLCLIKESELKSLLKENGLVVFPESGQGR